MRHGRTVYWRDDHYSERVGCTPDPPLEEARDLRILIDQGPACPQEATAPCNSPSDGERVRHSLQQHRPTSGSGITSKAAGSGGAVSP